MNILFVVPYAPNLIRVRPYNLIRSLTQNGNRVTVLSLWTTEQERKELEILRESCDQVYGFHLSRLRSFMNCLLALPTRTPLQAVYCMQPELNKLLLELTRQSDGRAAFDVVHVEHLRGAIYGLYIIASTLEAASRPPVVWDSVDSISLLFGQASLHSRRWVSRMMTGFELRRTGPFEAWLGRQFDRVLVSSSADFRAFLQGGVEAEDSGKLSVLTNGVDLDYFRPAPEEMREPATLVISGKMSYHANVTMVVRLVQEIMPLIWKRRPDVRLNIVGKDPPALIQAMRENPAIRVTGTVKDIRPYLQTSTIAVAPIAYGAGVQNKILEAMATATPVVATPQAVSALDVRNGSELLLSQGAQDFAEAVLSLLEDPGRRESIGQAGRRYVEINHRWSQVAERLEDIYAQAIQQKARAGVYQEGHLSVNRLRGIPTWRG